MTIFQSSIINSPDSLLRLRVFASSRLCVKTLNGLLRVLSPPHLKPSSSRSPSPQPQHPAYRSGNHRLFVRPNHANGDAAALPRNHRARGAVPRWVQLDAQETQAFADAPADLGG